MDFRTLLINRRSIRDYQDKEVPLSLVKEILQDTCLAPTARNSQPCRFIIVQDRDVIKKMSDENKKNLLFDISQDPASPLKQLESRFRDEKFNVFYNAPCLVLFVGPVGAAFLDVDCALTAAYFMFSATSRGLGTCWIGSGMHVRSHKMLRELGVPEDCRIVAPVIVGYPTGIPPASERHVPNMIKIL
jgi:nitroreductase